MIWIIYAPLQLICMIVCYLTNWLVVIFANETGDLPDALKYWQTWDDSLDVEWFVKETVPKFLCYDFDKHYISSTRTTPELEAVGRERSCVIIHGPAFTRKERIQRYFCRVLWLYRNCGYGFAFWIFGRNVNGNNMKMLADINNSNGFIRIGYDTSKSIFTRPWLIHMDYKIIGNLMTKIYLGWKIRYDIKEKTCRAMIATRLWLKIKH